MSSKQLGPGEHVVLSLRTHAKALLLPAITLIVLAGLTGYLLSIVEGDLQTPLRILIGVVAAVLFVWRVFWPFLGWLTTTYTITNRRLVTRTGILTRKGHDIPLPRISTVNSERDMIDRILGCGTLLLSEASDSQVKLYDVPKVEAVALTIANLLHDGDSATATSNDGT